MLPTGRLAVQEVVHRAKQIIGVDEVIVASPMSRGCEMIGDAVKGACSFHQVAGSETDVLTRYHKISFITKADIILRITADCPLLNPDLCSDMLATFKRNRAEKHGVDYMSNSWPARHYPKGWDFEIFSRRALDIANQEAIYPHDREHVTPYLQKHPAKFQQMFYKPLVDQGSWKDWSLDTFGDYLGICEIINAEIERNRQAAAE